jgi:hypothetical protein
MVLAIATFVGILEVSLMVLCGLRLLGVTPPTRLLLIVGVVHAVVNRGIRLLLYSVLSAPFGTHIGIALLLLFLLVWRVLRLRPYLAGLAVMLGFLILYIGSALVNLIMPAPVEVASLRDLVRVMLMEQLPLALVALAVVKWNLRLVPKRVELDRGD